VAEKQTQQSDLPSEWYQAYAEWGRRLLREHPDGLGRKPDFTKDGNARLLWSMDGFVVQQRAFQAVGQIDEIPFGDRSFSRHPQALADQVHIAQWMFPLGQKCWEEAKAEADERARQDREIARAAQERRLEIDRFSTEVDAIDTTKELESRAQALRDQVEEVRQGNSQANITLLQEKLSICYRRMIELERKTSKSNWRWAIGGIVATVLLGVAGIAYPVWDSYHRSGETNCEGRPSKPSTSEQLPTGSPPQPANKKTD
jgi:hypothetical protein